MCKKFEAREHAPVKMIGFGGLGIRDPRVAISSIDQGAYQTGYEATKALGERIQALLENRDSKRRLLLNEPIFIDCRSCPSAELRFLTRTAVHIDLEYSLNLALAPPS